MAPLSGDVVAALIGFGGAAVGALVAYRVAILRRDSETELEVARRDDARAAAEAALIAERQVRARIAARLLQSELAVARWRLTRAERQNAFWREGFELPLSDWQTYRETVAEYMEPDDWWMVSACYRSLDTTERQAVLARKLASSEKPSLTNATREQVTVSLRNLERAIHALESFSGTQTLESEVVGSDADGER